MVAIQSLISVCLLILVLLQIVVMIYLLFINHNTYKNDKEFYARMIEQDEEIMNVFRSHSVSLEEATGDEQTGPDSKTENKE
jgi:hypothetical protein